MKNYNKQYLVDDFVDREPHKKSWGFEEWIVNNSLYCGKRLHFDKVGGSTSMHYHVKKHETMYVEKGKFDIEFINTKDASRYSVSLLQGQSIEIVQNTVHRIVCMCDNSILIEFSTHHEDDDSYRVEKGL